MRSEVVSKAITPKKNLSTMRSWLIRSFLHSFLLCTLFKLSGVAADEQDQVTTTVIDIISSNPEFSMFLRLLQRNQLIPYINQLESITLVAPINSAFIALYPQLKPDSTTHVEGHSQMDQIIENFSIQDLNRYIIPEPVNSNHMPGFHIYHTKAYQYDLDKEHSSTLTSPISIQINKTSGSFLINNVTVVERDLYADTQNSYVQGTTKTFDHILSLKESLLQIPESSILQSFIDSVETDLTNKTILLFKDSASPFTDYQVNYLLNKQYGTDDVSYIVNSLLLPGYIGGVINQTVIDFNGFKTQLESNEMGSIINVNSTVMSSVSNIIATDGVIHIFESSDLIQRIQYDVLKYLVGLDCSFFVEELLFQDLGYLLTDNTLKQTIFHTKNAIDSSDVGLMTEDGLITVQSKSENLYHFIKDLNLSNLDMLNTTLLTTKYCSSKKLGSKDHCQRLKVTKLGEDSIMLNNNVLIEQGPFSIGETSIYIIDEDLSTPHDLLSSVSPIFECSRSLGYLHRLNLHKLKNHENGYTYFLPCFNSLENYDLTLKYLETNSTALENTMKGLIMEDLLYSDFEGDDFNSTTLGGDLIQLTDMEPQSSMLGFRFNNVEIDLVKGSDIIFDQGVAQPVDKFIIPSSIDIANTDILETFDTKIFQKYLSFFPHLSTAINNHTLLVPSGLSLSKFQFERNKTLDELLQVHVLPRESTLKLLNCGEETHDIMTLNPKVNLTCTRPANHDTFITVKGDDDVTNRVRILTKGCINNDQDICIFEIDKPIDSNASHFHISLPGVALAVGILLGALFMVLFVFCLMLVLSKAKGEAAKDSETSVGSSEIDENTVITGTVADEGTSLLVGNNNQNGHGSVGFENGYSEMADSNPIFVRKPSKVDFAV